MAATEWRSHRPFIAVLVAGLALRLLILPWTAELPFQNDDERHYHQLARNIRQGNGFAWNAGQPTSIRPPLYPFLIASIWSVVGTESRQAVQLVQVALSLLNTVLVYRLGLRLFGRRPALLAGAAFAFYPSLLAFNYVLLTEVLFTLLLTLVTVGYAALVERGQRSVAFLTGSTLGLAALTRSVLWLFPVVLCPLVYLMSPGSRRTRAGAALIVLAGYAAVVAPWAVRNTRLQKTVTIVDTMGGLNLRLGNYEHTALDRMWDTVSFTGEKSWAHELRQAHPDASSWTEGQKEKWAQRKAVAYMLEHPGVTVQRSAIKFADFWGLDREFLAAIQRGLYRPPAWFGWPAILGIVAGYALVMLLGSLGMFLAPPSDRRVHAFFIVVILFVCAVHTVVYGHSRYHVPLMLFFLLYAASAVAGRSWLRLRERPAAAAGVVVVWAVLLAIWGREVLFRDFDRIRELLRVVV
jgi:4-amino-4-deoxy-L-arabinose transferase-like glycosyltransferase